MPRPYKNYSIIIALAIILANSCSKGGSTPAPDPAPPIPTLLNSTAVKLDNTVAQTAAVNYNVKPTVAIKLSFNNALDRTVVASAVSLTENGTLTVPVNFAYENGDSTVVISATTALKNLTRYNVAVTTTLQSVKKGKLNTDLNFQFITQIDSTDKFPVISDNALLDTIQKRTFRYFWDYGHPVSGLARERSNATPETVTSGGSGFGIMAIPVAVSRNFYIKS
ncbi:MAG: Ig-like domain-containing protein [Ferruginibacter sp.]